MKDIVRKTFEEVTALNFRDILNGTSNLNRDQYGYFDPNIEDHWQTFQYGWSEGVQYGWSEGVQFFRKLLTQELTKTESANVYIEQLAQKIAGE